jgi:hypothetical protein
MEIRKNKISKLDFFMVMIFDDAIDEIYPYLNNSRWPQDPLERMILPGRPPACDLTKNLRP